ncbi:hypothetical protein PHET_08321 [Paragonimus heterotremus]|uniref:Uncharacterized protein n=1 Tax=Paragonimus heterotremus TaxID=100268 RepID=A0A8J4SWH3_9TREM|nr:hypothetical protein PHET_08321 [Paragonimus heterotremus]
MTPGWMFMELTSTRKNSKCDVHYLRLHEKRSDNQRLCNIESPDPNPGKERNMSIEDRKTLTELEHSKLLKDDHYETSLPWRAEPCLLTDDRPDVLKHI